MWCVEFDIQHFHKHTNVAETDYSQSVLKTQQTNSK